MAVAGFGGFAETDEESKDYGYEEEAGGSCKHGFKSWIHFFSVSRERK